MLRPSFLILKKVSLESIKKTPKQRKNIETSEDDSGKNIRVVLQAAAYPKTRRGLGLHSYSWTEAATKPAGMKQMGPLFGDAFSTARHLPIRYTDASHKCSASSCQDSESAGRENRRRFAGAGEGNGVGLQTNEGRPIVEKGVL
jgi:hypothetical protein